MNWTGAIGILGLMLLHGCAGPAEFQRFALGAKAEVGETPIAMGPRFARPKPKKNEGAPKPDAAKTAPQQKSPPEKLPCALPPCASKQPGPGAGGSGTASDFGSLRGMSRADAETYLRSLGAEVKTTQGGYTHFRFQDKSEVVIRPDGEVIRLPKPLYGPDGARTNKGARLDEHGVPTQSHNTGERVVD